MEGRREARQVGDTAMGEIEADVARLRDAAPPDVDVELNALLEALTVDHRQRAARLNDEILELVGALGGSKQRYFRERRGAVKRLVSEIYSPPRAVSYTHLTLPTKRIV